jgi:hypothetical protein
LFELEVAGAKISSICQYEVIHQVPVEFQEIADKAWTDFHNLDTYSAIEPLGRKNGQNKQLDKKSAVLFKQKKNRKKELMSAFAPRLV